MKYRLYRRKHSAAKDEDTNASSWMSKFKATVLDVYDRVSVFAVRVFNRYIKPLPWKRIGIVAGVVLLLVWSTVHFYFARPSRITSIMEQSAESAELIERQIIVADNQLQAAGISDVATYVSTFEQLSAEAEEVSLELPNQLLANYAFFTAEREVRERLDGVYENEAELSGDALRTSLDALLVAAQSIDSLFNLAPIEENPANYLAQLEAVQQELEVIQAESEVDLTTVIRIIDFIYEAADQYQISEDLDRFNAQYSNLASELLKELYVAWNDTIASTGLNQISAFTSSVEAFLAAVEQ